MSRPYIEIPENGRLWLEYEHTKSDGTAYVFDDNLVLVSCKIHLQKIDSVKSTVYERSASLDATIGANGIFRYFYSVLDNAGDVFLDAGSWKMWTTVVTLDGEGKSISIPTKAKRFKVYSAGDL